MGFDDWYSFIGSGFHVEKQMKPKPIKIPPVLCYIGQVREVDTDTGKFKFKIKDRVMLYTTTNGKKLFCLKSSAKKSKKADFEKAVENKHEQVSDAMDLYRQWHAFDAVSGSLASVPRGFLFDAGRAIHIIYSSDKWGGKKRNYIHEFKTPPKVWANKKKDPTLLVLTGGNIAVKKEGITG